MGPLVAKLKSYFVPKNKAMYGIGGLFAVGGLYYFGLRPYLEDQNMKRFEEEARSIYNARQKKEGSEFERD